MSALSRRINRTVNEREISNSRIVSVTIKNFQELTTAAGTFFKIKVDGVEHTLKSAPFDIITDVFPVMFEVPPGRQNVNVEVQAWAISRGDTVQYDISSRPGDDSQGLSLVTIHHIGTTEPLFGNGTLDERFGGHQGRVSVLIQSGPQIATTSATISSLDGIPRTSVAETTEKLSFQLTNTGTKSGSFDARFSTRREDRRQVDVSLPLLRLSPNESGTFSFDIPWGGPGFRDIRIVVWEGSTLVADTGWLTDYISVVTEATPTPIGVSFQATFVTEIAGATNARGVSVDKKFRVFVTDGLNHQVRVFDRDGALINGWGTLGHSSGEFVSPAGIAIDTFGSVYVTDFGRVQVFDSVGSFLIEWGTFGSEPGQFILPLGVTLDDTGTVYVVDLGNSRVQVFDPFGAFLRAWGSEGSGDGEFQSPYGIAIGVSGNVYVTDQDNNRVQMFSPAGVFLRSWGSEGSGEGQFFGPNGIAVDGTGNVYIADGNHRIQVFSSVGVYMGEWGSFGSGPGQFNFPVGIAVDSAGRVYVADVGNDRIQVFTVQTPPAE